VSQNTAATFRSSFRPTRAARSAWVSTARALRTAHAHHGGRQGGHASLRDSDFLWLTNEHLVPCGSIAALRSPPDPPPLACDCCATVLRQLAACSSPWRDPPWGTGIPDKEHAVGRCADPRPALVEHDAFAHARLLASVKLTLPAFHPSQGRAALGGWASDSALSSRRGASVAPVCVLRACDVC
jgi:hypothetical protein